MVVAGASGALLLSIFSWFIIQKVSLSKIVTTVIIGGIAAVAMYVVIEISSASTWPYVIAFAIWQVSVGVDLLSEPSKK